MVECKTRILSDRDADRVRDLYAEAYRIYSEQTVVIRGKTVVLTPQQAIDRGDKLVAKAQKIESKVRA